MLYFCFSRILDGLCRESFTFNTRTLYIQACMIDTVLLTQYCAGDKIKKNEMGGACSAYVGEERCLQGFGGET